MSEAYTTVMNAVKMYTGNSVMVWIFAVAVIYIMIIDKHKRKSIIYPTLILMAIIINPVTYKYILCKLLIGGTYGTYWRVIWMIPEVAIIAYAMVSAIIASGSYLKKCIITIALAAVIGLCGNNMYQYEVNFETADNAYKLPQEAIEVSDVLLDNDEEPRAVVDKKLYCYIRQYSTNIKMMYGRNAEWYIQSGNTREVNAVVWLNNQKEISIKDVFYLTKDMRYQYWVVSKQAILDDESLQEYGYSKCGETKNYIIYFNENM